MKFIGCFAVLSAVTACGRDVPATATGDAVDGAQVAGTDGADILGWVDVQPFDINWPDSSHDAVEGPVEVPRFQCGLEEGVAPLKPSFVALPPYVSTGGDALVADMTGDGIPELLSSSTLYLNGTTIPVEGPQLSTFSRKYAYGDFDGDGLWDVIGYASSKKVGLRRQSQLGVFEEKIVVLSLAEAAEAWFVAANLEGDETPEVVIVDGKRLRAYRFNSTTKSLTQIGEGYSEGIKLGVPFGFDVNLDGFDEIIYGGVNKFLDNGTVTHLVDAAEMSTSPWVTHYELFDVDLDNQEEVVGYSSEERWVVIRAGPEPEYETTSNWFQGLDTWPLGDLNGDGLDEMLVGNDTEVWLYGRTGLSEFVELAHAPGKADGRPPVLDVDLDGDLDVYQTGPVLFENHGPLGFEAHYAPMIKVSTPSYDGVPEYPTDPTEKRDASCTCLPAKKQGAAVDFDGDGKDDIVIASSATVTVARSLGDGRFGPQVKVAPNVSTYDPARWVGFELETPDLNGDGRPEIVALTRNTEWHCNQEMLWAAYSVKDDFSLEPFDLPIDIPHGVDFGDIDGNGLIDIVSFHPWDMTSPTWSTDEHCQPVEYLDRDGAAERMAGCCHKGNSSAGVMVTRQVSPGIFESGPLTPLRAEAAGYGCTFDEGFSVVDGMLVDVTGDGKLDLVASHAQVAPDAIDVLFTAPRGIACYPCEWILRAPSWRISGAFLVAHPGDGNGGFAPGRTIGGTAYDAVRSLDHSDLDGDGDDDLLVTTDFWRGVLENPGTELESPDLSGPVCDPSALEDLDSAPFERNTLNWWAADWMRPANLNGDRCMDFAPAVYFKAYGIGSVQAILGDGVGPGSWNYVGIPGTSATSYDNVIPGDYDGDGLDDLYVIANTWSGVPARVLLNRTPRPTLRPERPEP